MENFIVSARKYRPSTFNTVVGQSHITNTLKNAIKNNQLAQAFLFTGPRGVGKTTCARILAKTINCMNLDESIEPCNKCESCVSFNKSASFNIHELDAASNNSVDDIRILVDQVRIPPQLGKYKVHIIDEVHMLSQQAFNAFLKTLEEPPEYAKFILATTEKHKIIPTILSRCQIYDFKRIGVKDIAEHLKYVAASENIAAEPEALQIIAQKADGALRDALSIFDQLVSFTGHNLTYAHVVDNLNVLDYDYYFDITARLFEGDLFEALIILDKIIESGFDGQHFLGGFAAHLRDLLVCSDEKTVNLLEVGDKIKVKYLEQARMIDVAFLLQSLNIVQKIDFTYKSSSNKRLQLEIALMQISGLKLLRQSQPDAAASAPKPVEKKTVVHSSSGAVEKSPALPSAAGTSPAVKPPASVTQQNRHVEKVSEIAGNYLPGSISIKEEAVKKEEEQELIENFNKQSEEFKNARLINKDELDKAWKKLAESIPEDQPDLRSTLFASSPSTGDDFAIELEVKNQIQKAKIESSKQMLVPFLRDQLNNKFVILNVTVNAEKTVSAKPVSAAEKFKHLAEKNPAIVDLQKKFGLELNY
jgi:DNA polymerase III subunit gamma/tau